MSTGEFAGSKTLVIFSQSLSFPDVALLSCILLGQQLVQLVPEATCTPAA